MMEGVRRAQVPIRRFASLWQTQATYKDDGPCTLYAAGSAEILAVLPGVVTLLSSGQLGWGRATLRAGHTVCLGTLQSGKQEGGGGVGVHHLQQF